MSIIGLAMATMITQLQKQNKGLQQKLESIQIEQSLTRLLTDNNNCKCMFQNLTIPSDNSNVTITGGIKAGCSGVNLLTPGTEVHSSGTGLKVSSVELKNITNVDATRKLANIVVNFDQNSLASPLRSISIIGQSFLVSGTTVTECVGLPGAKEMCQGMGGTWISGACQMSPQLACTSLGGNWTGSACSLTPGPDQTCTNIGGTWNGSSCSTVAKPQESCAVMGGTWSSGNCQMNAKAISACTGVGGTWNGNYCQLAAPSGRENCIGMGGTWTGNSCKLASNPGAETCSTIGGSWTGNQCQMPVSDKSVCLVTGGTWGNIVNPSTCNWPWNVQNNYSENSDVRIKKDIHAFTPGLKEALAINPFQYKYNGLGGTIDDGKLFTGVMAQDLEKVVPNLVRYRKGKLHPEDLMETSIRSVDYQGITLLLLNAIKDQQKIIDTQQDSLSEATKLIQENQAQIKTMQKKLQALEKKLNH